MGGGVVCVVSPGSRGCHLPTVLLQVSVTLEWVASVAVEQNADET